MRGVRGHCHWALSTSHSAQVMRKIARLTPYTVVLQGKARTTGESCIWAVAGTAQGCGWRTWGPGATPGHTAPAHARSAHAQQTKPGRAVPRHAPNNEGKATTSVRQRQRGHAPLMANLVPMDKTPRPYSASTDPTTSSPLPNCCAFSATISNAFLAAGNIHVGAVGVHYAWAGPCTVHMWGGGGEVKREKRRPRNADRNERSRDALCFMVKTWGTHKTTETALSNGWQLAVGSGCRLVVGSLWMLVVGGWQQPVLLHAAGQGLMGVAASMAGSMAGVDRQHPKPPAAVPSRPTPPGPRPASQTVPALVWSGVSGLLMVKLPNATAGDAAAGAGDTTAGSSVGSSAAAVLEEATSCGSSTKDTSRTLGRFSLAYHHTNGGCDTATGRSCLVGGKGGRPGWGEKK